MSAFRPQKLYKRHMPVSNHTPAQDTQSVDKSVNGAKNRARAKVSLFQRIVPTKTGTFALSELWITLAYDDLRNRYRGSFLGPLWLTIATGVLVFGIGLLYGGLFGQSLENYLPYIAVSIVIWTLISTVMTEAAMLFPGEGAVLKQMPVPASLFITRLIYRNILVSAHNFVIIVIVLLIYPPTLGWSALTVPLGFIILIANLWWISVVLSIIGARFRDVPPIVISILQILFFLTPIIWRAEDIPNRMIFIEMNPIYHLIEIVRAPIISGQAPVISLWVCGIAAIVGMWGALHLLAWSRTRLIYWL